MRRVINDLKTIFHSNPLVAPCIENNGGDVFKP